MIITIMLPTIFIGIVAGWIGGGFLAGIRLWNVVVDLFDTKI